MRGRRGLSRRAVLTGAVAAPFVAGASRAAEARIVVVGAGLAGLAAAQALRARGHSPLVLEARERIGGRVHTSLAWPDLPMDLGASWIHGVAGNPITELARAAGARFVATDLDADRTIGPDGATISPDLRGAQRIVRDALKAAQGLDRDVSILHAVETSAGWRAAPERERRLVRHVLNSTIEHEYGGPASQTSAWYGEESDEYDGADAIFPAGYGQIAAHLAKGLDVRLGQPVRRIAPGRVTLASGESVAAGRIVVSVPLGVLQAGRIAFERPLAGSRQAAIGALRMGLLNKTWLRFARTAWPADIDWIEWLGRKPGYWAEWVSLARVLKAPVLVGFNAADEARNIEALDDRATLAAAHEALRAMFGSAFPAPVAAQITRWGADEWSLGAYSFNPVGMRARQREDLFGLDWDGALGFCGEATSHRRFGTAHGAVETGRKLADAMA